MRWTRSLARSATWATGWAACWCNCRRACVTTRARPRPSSPCCAGAPACRWHASPVMPAGSSRRPMPCGPGTGWPGWRRTPRACPRRRCREATAPSGATGAGTARRASTTAPTATGRWHRSPAPCATPAGRAHRPGASSTTPPRATRLPTPRACSPCSRGGRAGATAGSAGRDRSAGWSPLYTLTRAGVAAWRSGPTTTGRNAMLDWNTYRDQVKARIGDVAKLSPDTVRGYATLSGAGAKTGHLDAKTRELIALAVAVTTRCDGCITVHVDDALREGATRDEIAEALGVAVALNAGAALVFSGRVMDAIDAHS